MVFQISLKRLLPTIVFSALLLTQSQAFAQDLPPEPIVEQSTPESSNLPEEPVLIDTENNRESLNPDSPDQAVEPQTVSDTLEKQSTKSVVDGPLQNQRQALYNQIQAAEESGIGIKNYMMAFKYIEGMAERGESEEAIKKRMVPLVSALASQLKTKQYLKNRPKTQTANTGFPDPNSLLAPNQGIPNSLRMYGGMGGAGTNDLIKKIVADERLKGKIPKNLDKNMIKGLDQNMLRDKLKDPRVQELLKKYKGQF